MLLFYIFFFGTECVSASVLTDVTRQRIDENSLTSALQNVSKNLMRQFTNQENLVVLGMSRTISIMAGDIVKLRETLADTNKRFDDLKLQFDKKIKEVELNILEHQSKQEEIKDQLQEFQSNMSTLIGLTTRVGFTVGMSTRGSIGTTTVVFPKIIYNSGGGYNSSTGIFTAPVTGDYVFYVAVASDNKMRLYLDISVTGSAKVRTMSWYSGGDSIYQTGTNMVVYHLQKGDRVYVKRNAGNRYYSQSVPITTFSGFLL